MKKVLTGLDSREYEHPAGREVMINKKLIIINLTILFNLVHLFANPYTCYKSVGTAKAPQYYSDELIETVIFSNDFSRINKPYYMMVHDWNYGFDYPQLMTTFIYEKCKSPKKEKKSTPFY